MLVLLESIFLVPYAISKCNFSEKYLDIAKSNIKSYPWGKDSFDLLISSVNKVKSGTLKMDIKGFPMALQLWLLASVPKLQDAFDEVDHEHSDWFICARYLSTGQPTYAQIWNHEDEKDAEVTCVLSSFNDAADLSALLDEEEDGDFGEVMDLVKNWRRNFIELEESEEFISQMHQKDQFQGQEVEFDETLDEDVGDRSDALVEELQQLNFQYGESSVGEPSVGEINTSSIAPPYQSRHGCVVKPVIKFSPSGHKTKSRRR